MKRMSIGAAALLLGGVVAATVANGAEPKAAQREGVSGRFSLIMMVHTSSSSFGDLPGVSPWNGRPRAGKRFVYRSIPCTGMAPVNNIASDLPSYNTRVRGSRVPSSMRAHPFAFRLVREDGKWRMVGSITFTVCKLGSGPTPPDDPIPDADKPKIKVRFNATFRRITGEEVRWHGKFRLRGGTGRYEDLTGSGSIAGYFLCFNPAGCTTLGGNYLDGQIVLHGNFRDPTPDLSG